MEDIANPFEAYLPYEDGNRRRSLAVTIEIATSDGIHIQAINWTSNKAIWRYSVKGNSWGQGNGGIEYVLDLSLSNFKKTHPDTDPPVVRLILSKQQEAIKLKEEIDDSSDRNLFILEIPGDYYCFPHGNNDLYKLLKLPPVTGCKLAKGIKLEEYTVELVGQEVDNTIILEGVPGQNYATRNDTHCLYLFQKYSVKYPDGRSKYRPARSFQVWRARVMKKNTEAFIEYRWHPLKGVSVDLRGLDRVEPKRREVEGRNALKNLIFLGLLKESRGGSEGKYNLSDLKRNYQTVYSKWKESSSIYKAIQKSKVQEGREKWKEIILSIFPEFNECPDLVECLSDVPQLPKEVADKYVDKGGAGTPGDIALEHAARLCGAEPFTFALSTLKDELRKQNKYK